MRWIYRWNTVRNWEEVKNWKLGLEGEKASHASDMGESSRFNIDAQAM
jgi:hypothetical protein